MFPLSYAQQRLWFLNQLEGPDATYNAPVLRRLEGHLDVAALRAAWHDVLGRHESLRTVIREQDGIPTQSVLDADESGLCLAVVDCEQTELAGMLETFQTQPFDLSTDLPVRAWLVRVHAEHHVLALVLHHIVCDGWSVGLLQRDLKNAYTARLDGASPDWEPLPVQYADYTLWQQELLGDTSDPAQPGRRQLDFWREALAGLPEEVELPADRHRTAVARHRGRQTRFTVRPQVTARLRDVARGSGATLFMVLQAAVAALLTRMGSGTDIPLATAVAGRSEEALDDLVGFFVNTLVLRTDTSGDPGFTELLSRVRDADAAAFAHQDIPFERLVEELNPPRSRSRNPLAQVSVELHEGGADRDVWPGLVCTALPADLGGAVKFDLTWDFVETDGGLTGLLGTSDHLFDPGTGERLAARLVRLLTAITEEPATRLSRLPLVSADERRELLSGSYREQHEDLGRGVVERIRDHARAHPEAVAVTDASDRVDYARLVGCASALSRRLGAGDPTGRRGFVGVLAERGPGVSAGLLGILGAGCVYVPLDTKAPRARNAARLADTEAAWLFTDAKNAEAARLLAESLDHPVEVVPLEQDPDPLDDLAPVTATAGDLAYVIFTSGSTGKPKGAMVRHLGLTNNLLGEAEAIGIADAGHAVASSAPLTFDISVWQMLTALIFGGRVHAMDDETARDPRALFQAAEAAELTVLQVVPSLLQAALDDWDALGGAPTRLHLHRLAVTGEALPPDLCRRWLDRYPGIPLVNCYGPTECSDDVTQATITADTLPPGALTPIGVATRGIRLYVLDDRLQPVPEGVPGELYIGGVGVGPGYLAEPCRTALTFVADPFTPEPGQRMYRSGDLVRHGRDGQLEFLGRQDHQVKIRGQRIELGEVEFVLRGLDGIRDVAVVAVPAPGGQMLVGYYVGEVDAARVRAALAELLPEAMVPGALVPMEVMPLTANGKLDRQALPAPQTVRSGGGREPATALERALVETFEDTLGTDGLGAEDGFFASGGHSLLAVRLVRAINQRLGSELSLSAVFTHQSPAALAAFLESTARPVEAAHRPEPAVDPLAWTADVYLPEDFDPSASTGPVVSEPRHILLTGATGFFGAHILRELLDRTSATVHCLVRAADDNAASERLRTSLSRFGLWEDRLRPRVVSLAGDLGLPELGLGPDRFGDLARRIDVIHHNGARVNLVEPYEMLRGTNVDGTREVLRLAARHRIKAVHYVSTASTVVAGPQDPQLLPESWVSDPALVDSCGYVRSKWVAEQLVMLAGRRGLPTAVYRPSRISGHSVTGAIGADDAFWLYVRACIELGARPDGSADGGDLRDNLVPVDLAARTFVHLASDEAPRAAVYNLVAPEPTALSEVLDHAHRKGHALRKVAPGQWRTLLERAESGESGAVGPVLAVALLNGSDAEAAGRYPDVFDRRNLERGLAATGWNLPAPGVVELDRCLNFLRATGMVPAPTAAPDALVAANADGGLDA
ncbi:amino acid adenylation domain-containing protein [Streptomyces sp. NPDC051001]|uniref:non-ribosomal peptide synthetase n=1 Tax=Streptomyces sp. NPDC051001 TaxID=3155795 RepID=UPI003438D167